jgi:hypothetical protein
MTVTGWVPWKVRLAAQKDRCEGCGSDSRLGLHHKDQDRTNNSLENLQTLCPSCHTTWHWANGKEPWRRREPTCMVCDRPSRHLGLCPTHRSRRHGSPYLRKIKAGLTWLWVADSGPQSGQEWAACPPASLTGWTDCGPSETRSSRRSPNSSATASPPTKKDG